MIDGAFSFVRGIGPSRERQLRRMGIRRWDDVPPAGPVLSPGIDARLRQEIARVRALLDERRFGELHDLLPVRDRWRLFPHVQEEAGYLDIETGLDGRVTVVGVYDPQRGPRLFVRGHNLGAFAEEPLPHTLLTFNGGSFDLPILCRTFPGWTPPPVHLDLCVIFRQLGERGGLKAIEERLGLGRPDHLRGVGGADAVDLWDCFSRTGDAEALRTLLEYNLYDVVQLRSLAEIACERLATAFGGAWSVPRRFHRGDVLLDLTRCVEAVVARAHAIVPDAIEDAERRAMIR